VKHFKGRAICIIRGEDRRAHFTYKERSEMTETESFLGVHMKGSSEFESTQQPHSPTTLCFSKDQSKKERDQRREKKVGKWKKIKQENLEMKKSKESSDYSYKRGERERER